jgi:uncharacterized membrane protein
MSVRTHRVKTFFRGLLGVLMVLAGLVHFVNPEPYLMMMPDYLPWHEALVFISGVFEVLLGAALFVPKLREYAGWGLIALFIAVLPANIWMASEGIQPPGMEMSPTGAWVRVAFQAVFIYWAWAVTRPDADQVAAAQGQDEASPDRA